MSSSFYFASLPWIWWAPAGRQKANGCHIWGDSHSFTSYPMWIFTIHLMLWSYARAGHNIIGNNGAMAILQAEGTMSIRHHDPSSTWFLQLVHVADAPNHDPQVRRSWSIASHGTFSTLLPAPEIILGLGSAGRSATLQLQHRDGPGTCKLHEDFHSAGWKWTWAYMGQFNVQCLWHSVTTPEKLKNQQNCMV